MSRQGVFPGEALVDAYRQAFVIHKQIVRTLGPAQWCAIEWGVGLDGLRSFGWTRIRRHSTRIGRFVAEAARAVDGAE